MKRNNYRITHHSLRDIKIHKNLILELYMMHRD